MLLNPCPNTSNNQDRSNHHSPQGNMQSRNVKRRLRGGNHRPQLKNQQHIPRHTMILVNLLSRVNTSENPDREEVLHHAHRCLENDQNIGNQTHHTMRGGEAWVVALVDFDDEESCNEREQTDGLDRVMNASSGKFLAGSTGWLEDEGCLDLKEESRGVQELVCWDLFRTRAL